MKIDWKYYKDNWDLMTSQPSGNYVSNLPLDEDLKELLLNNSINKVDFDKQVRLNEVKFDRLSKKIDTVTGLNILSGLQKLHKPDHLTVYRAIRFPTKTRIISMIKDRGISTLNYEHNRLMRIYENDEYMMKREQLMKDPRFSFQPQERVVPGLPVFFNINDAVHIHRAYRGEDDIIGIVTAFIPYNLIKQDTVEIYSNDAIVENYSDDSGDRKINYYNKNREGRVCPSYKALSVEGSQIYETYCKGIPEDLESCENLGIEFKYFLLKLYKPQIDIKSKRINGVDISSELAQYKLPFLYGFWGDDNIFMRRVSQFLPNSCYEITKK
ncbi:hypothetical protein [Tenacibaculum agarivorans]|uniref:hypothetical protein n=1 Tax=Tenacibaculum agarivorans TaxID=1908389 RepID=UPI00094BAC97|nr:hypothetical protein [Tenacibaculum agarivorans]